MREINSRANTTFGKTPYGVLLEKSVTTLRRAKNILRSGIRFPYFDPGAGEGI
jgi:hypothetical protein